MKGINRVQNLGAQAIVGTFCKVATAVAEAEASILPARERFAQKATKLWIGLRSLPESKPLRRIKTQKFRKFVLSLQQIASIY